MRNREPAGLASHAFGVRIPGLPPNNADEYKVVE